MRATALVAATLFSSACSDGIGSLVEPVRGEHGATTCSPDRFPSRVANLLSCCQDGHRTWHTNDGKTLVYRVYGAPCTEADGVGTNCGQGSDPFVQCVYGPCGARVEWAVRGESARVFHPDSNPDKCGWEVTNVGACRTGCEWPAGVTREFPESFDGQETYPGLTATCPYVDCRVGGSPI